MGSCDPQVCNFLALWFMRTLTFLKIDKRVKKQANTLLKTHSDLLLMYFKHSQWCFDYDYVVFLPKIKKTCVVFEDKFSAEGQ